MVRTRTVSVENSAPNRRRVKVSAPVLIFAGLMAYAIQKMIPPTEGVTFGAFRGGSAADIGKSLFTVEKDKGYYWGPGKQWDLTPGREPASATA